MAGLALRIIIGRVAVQLVVGVVAGEATDTRVIRVVTLATGQPVRLETDIGDVKLASRGDIFPRAVTLPAKTGYLLCGQFGQVLHYALSRIALGHPRKMLLSRPMTALTLDSGGHLIQRQLSPPGTIRRMAAEAEQPIVEAQATPRSFKDVIWRNFLT